MGIISAPGRTVARLGLRAVFGAAAGFVALVSLGFSPSYALDPLSIITDLADASAFLSTDIYKVGLASFAGAWLAPSIVFSAWDHRREPVRFLGKACSAALSFTATTAGLFTGAVIGAAGFEEIFDPAKKFFDLEQLMRVSGLRYGWDAVTFDSAFQGMSRAMTQSTATMLSGLADSIRIGMANGVDMAFLYHVEQNPQAAAGMSTFIMTALAGWGAWHIAKPVSRAPARLANMIAGHGYVYNPEEQMRWDKKGPWTQYWFGDRSERRHWKNRPQRSP